MPVDARVQNFTEITNEPTSDDSLVVVNRNNNAGQIIDYELLADKILDKLTSKTFSSLTTTSKVLPGAVNELGSTSKRLRGVIAVTANDNLNTYTTPGEYYCNSNATAATITNCPVTTAFRLTVEGSTSPSQTANIRQTLRTHTKNATYTRWTTTSGSTWSAWEAYFPGKTVTVTAGTNVTWAGKAQTIGDMAFVGGSLTTTGAINAGSMLLGGLPAATTNVLISIYNNTSGTTYTGLITTNGTITPHSNLPSGATLKIAAVYPISGT